MCVILCMVILCALCFPTSTCICMHAVVSTRVQLSLCFFSFFLFFLSSMHASSHTLLCMDFGQVHLAPFCLYAFIMITHMPVHAHLKWKLDEGGTHCTHMHCIAKHSLSIQVVQSLLDTTRLRLSVRLIYLGRIAEKVKYITYLGCAPARREGSRTARPLNQSNFLYFWFLGWSDWWSICSKSCGGSRGLDQRSVYADSNWHQHHCSALTEGRLSEISWAAGASCSCEYCLIQCESAPLKHEDYKFIPIRSYGEAV